MGGSTLNRNVAVQLNYFADTLAFDGREMEALRQQVDLLIRFDPRKGALDRRERLLSSLGGRVAEKSSHFVRDAMGEAAIMSAYALAHTAIQREPDRLRLADIFDGLIDLQTELSPEYKGKNCSIRGSAWIGCTVRLSSNSKLLRQRPQILADLRPAGQILVGLDKSEMARSVIDGEDHPLRFHSSEFCRF